MTLSPVGRQLSYPVVVVGAGPAGIAAAVSASQSGSRVLLLDSNSAPGGQIWKSAARHTKDAQAKKWLDRLASADLKVLHSAQVISGFAQGRWLYAETTDSGFNIHFEKLILAGGAREIFLPFPGWTLPGIFGIGGLQSLAKSGFPVRGKSVVLAGTGPLLFAVAAHLRGMGARVKLIAEQASRSRILRFTLTLLRHPRKLGQALALRTSLASVPYRLGCWVEAAEGDGQVRTVHLKQGSRTWSETCDLAGIAYGLAPNLELGSLLGCRFSESGFEVDEFQRSSVEDIFCAGECTGIGGVDLSLVEGEIAGYTAAGATQKAYSLLARKKLALRFARSLARTFALHPSLTDLPHPDTIVCRCEDVTWGGLQQYSSFREAKLQARCGMGPCQGRVCGSALQFLRGWNIDSVRPPILPARVESLTTMQATEGEL